jgi:hypothetical protein
MQVTDLTLNDSMSTLLDNALDRWEADHEEPIMPTPRSRESAS